MMNKESSYAEVEKNYEERVLNFKQANKGLS